jgi:uncharacterized protein (DUF58 family)
METPKEIAITLDDLMRLEHLVSNFSLLPEQPVHSVLSGKHASKLRGRGLDFSEVRRYVFGDDIRNIDWKVTARTKVTHTKVFNEEKERPAFMIVDQSSSMFFASEGTMKSVIAAKMAAIGGFKVLKASDRIGGLVFDDDTFESVTPKRSRKALMHLLELIVQKNQKLVTRDKMVSKAAFINKVLFKAQNMVTHDYVVVIISDFQYLDDQGRIYLSNMARHNDVIAVMVSDPMEYDLPNVKFPVSDGENQVMIADKEEVRAKFKEESRSLRDDNLVFLRKYNIPIMELNTIDPLVDQIKRNFGRA